MKTWSGLHKKEGQSHQEERYPGQLYGGRVGEACCESHRHILPAERGVRC